MDVSSTGRGLVSMGRSSSDGGLVNEVGGGVLEQSSDAAQAGGVAGSAVGVNGGCSSHLVGEVVESGVGDGLGAGTGGLVVGALLETASSLCVGGGLITLLGGDGTLRSVAA